MAESRGPGDGGRSPELTIVPDGRWRLDPPAPAKPLVDCRTPRGQRLIEHNEDRVARQTRVG